MRPTRWQHRSLDRWNDDEGELERVHRKREAAEEIAGQLADDEDDRAEAAVGPLRDSLRGWDDAHGWTTVATDAYEPAESGPRFPFDEYAELVDSADARLEFARLYYEPDCS